jgi:uncharacterized protein YgiM (DUF1202 family)
MKRLVPAALAMMLLALASCQVTPPPEPEPVPDPVAPAPPVEPAQIGMVKVNASALNVRAEASLDAEVLTQVKRGENLPLLQAGDSWMKVQLPDGRTGWAASRFLVREGEKATAKKRKGSCLPDSDFAFATAPTPTFSDSGAKGDVVVEAHVDARGNVKSTKLIANTTGDEALAFLTEREIRSATFIPPVRNCAAREFIYTYKRTF